MIEKMSSSIIELEMSLFFDYQRNFVIPNISKGFRCMNYEIDLMVVTKAMYAYEVEIKISPGDLRRDALKYKWNYCRDQHYFRKSYFAMPYEMINYKDLVPERAGIVLIRWDDHRKQWYPVEIRKPVVDSLAKKVTEAEYKHLGELAMLRMWALKGNIRRLSRENQTLTEKEKQAQS